MTQEALKLSQEALAGLKDVKKQVRELIAENKALKEALAQTELCQYGQEPASCTSNPMDCQCAIDASLAQTQEPVGVVHHKLTSTLGADYEQVAVFVRPVEPGTKLYTTQPQRTWVDLTEDETERLIHNFGNDPHTLLDEVDARLRSRNT
ncbi:hypothetical protein UFOVP588_20 [uncultured Caudovirales phage]|uniref:Uncharacterized protein n=1 Tax=uncultured Caudovirales phage TaxID=2100421 RepID=A0A6J5N2N8_9CAUD|nr:hypothetical protein UFOVP588_20 [uncultured Caudovirales phage]